MKRIYDPATDPVQLAADWLGDNGLSVMGRDAQRVMWGNASADWLVSAPGSFKWIEFTNEGLVEFARKGGMPTIAEKETP